MNENNQNIRHDQDSVPATAQNENSGEKMNQQPSPTPTPEQETPKQENVYTVGAYAEQSNGTAQTPNPAPQNIYTAPSGNQYAYSSQTPPYGQYGGYYTYESNPQKPKKKKGKGAVIALAVAGCLLLSLLMGVGGAAITWSILDVDYDGREDQPTISEKNPDDVNRPSQETTAPNGSVEMPSEIVIKKDTVGTKVVTTSGSIGDENLSYADVVALVENSVVEITTNYVVSGSMFSQYVSSGAGSGVIISQSGKVGYIVTNNHVIEDATSIVVRLKDGTELPATLVGTDAMTDLAVLMVNTDIALTCAELGDSDSLVVGQEVLAIGNPLGELGGTVTNGIVSALEREVKIDGEKMTLLQTNAAVNPGNSGGGLFNMYGKLIGVVNAKSSGDDVEGLGFAIPVNTVYNVVNELITYGYVRNRPALGITLNVARQQYFLQIYSVVYVTDPGKTNLQVNDILYTIDGVEVTSSDIIASAIHGKSVGDTVEIVVLRNNEQVKVEVELVEYVPQKTNN